MTKCDKCGKQLRFTKNALEYQSKHYLALMISKWEGKRFRRLDLGKLDIKLAKCNCIGWEWIKYEMP